MDVDVVTANGSSKDWDGKLVLAPVVSPVWNEKLIVGRNVCGGDDKDLVGEIWVNVPVCVLTSGIQRVIDVRDIAFKDMSFWIEGVSCLITVCDDIVGLVGWIGDCLQCNVFSTCVDPYYGEAWNVLGCEETFACARKIVGICNKDFLSEVTIVS